MNNNISTTVCDEITIQSTSLNGERLYTYFVVMYLDISPMVKQSTDLQFRKGVINICIVKQTKPFTEKRFEKYMKKYYPQYRSEYRYCYDVTTVSIMINNPNASISATKYSSIAEMYKLIITRLRSVLNHYNTTSERLHPIDSKRSFKTYDMTNFLSTIYETNGIVEGLLREYGIQHR